MAERRGPPDDRHPIQMDLVEYVVVSVPDEAALPALRAALQELVDSGTIRVLDVVGLARGPDGSLVQVEIGSEPADADVMLTDHDVGLAALALPPGMAGIVVLTEGRWAGPLALAARQAGGQIVGGERIPSDRIEAALEDAVRDASNGEGTGP